MNKEKIAEIKNKLKKHAPEIIVLLTATALAAYGINGVKKQITATPLDDVDFDPMPMVDRDTQKTLMEDEAFGLYKLTDDEYMFARIIAE